MSKSPKLSDSKIVAVIRNSKEYGQGSCHFMDECYSDAELLEALRDTEMKLDTEKQVLQAAEWMDGLNREQESNCAWDGMANHPQTTISEDSFRRLSECMVRINDHTAIIEPTLTGNWRVQHYLLFKLISDETFASKGEAMIYALRVCNY